MRVRVTDHALVRYIQRVHDIDMEQVRAALADIAQPFVDARVKHAWAGSVCLVFDGATLITVLDSAPSTRGLLNNDRGGRNGTDQRSEKPHWKHIKRLRK